MAGETIKSFLVELGFDVDSSGQSQFDASLANTTKRVVAFGAGIQAAAAMLYAGVYQIASAKSELLSLSEAVNVTVADLQELHFVAEQSGASADALNSSVQSLTEQLGGAAIGQGGLETFHRLGISVKGANGEIRDTIDVLMDVGEKIKGLDRAKANMYLGQLGIDRSLYRMLTDDISGMRKAYQDMYKSVGLDANKAAEDSRTFVAQMRSLWTMVKMVGDALSAVFVDQMGRDVETLRRAMQDNMGKIMQVLKQVVDVILRLGKFFFTLTGRIAMWFSALDDGAQNVILGIIAFAAAWRWLNLAFIATPIGAIITGLIGLLALIDDFMVWRDGGDSLIDWGPWAEDIDKVIDGISILLDALGELWSEIKGPIMGIVGVWAKTFVAWIRTMLGVAVDMVRALVSLFTGDFSGAFDAVCSAANRLWELFKELFANLFDLVGHAGEMLGNVVGWAAKKLGKFVGLGGDDDAPQPAPILGAPTPAAAMAGAAMARRGDTTVNNTTHIAVNGNGDPAATARAVGRTQNTVNADLVRHAKGAAR